jgi:hypothetical protein
MKQAQEKIITAEQARRMIHGEKARTLIPLTDMNEDGIGEEVRSLKGFAVLFQQATWSGTLGGRDEDEENVAVLLTHLVDDLDAKVEALQAIYGGPEPEDEGEESGGGKRSRKNGKAEHAEATA